MRKLITFLSTLSLVGSTATTVMACERSVILYDCFDENGNNVTTKDYDVDQALDISYIKIFLLSLDNTIFSNSESFYQMNNKTSQELVTNYFKGPEGQDLEGNFIHNFTFLITNYDSIDGNVIEKMKEDLADKEVGMYVFLNLPGIDVANIKNETTINFQALFMIKKEDKIIGNKNNDWFYWFDWKTENDPKNNQYLLNLTITEQTNRVVTNFHQK